jgi:hypothetical protein
LRTKNLKNKKSPKQKILKTQKVKNTKSSNLKKLKPYKRNIPMRILGVPIVLGASYDPRSSQLRTLLGKQGRGVGIL